MRAASSSLPRGATTPDGATTGGRLLAGMQAATSTPSSKKE
jgi:hypothetical protein